MRKVKEATSNAIKLSQPSRFSQKEFAKHKKHLQDTGRPIRLSADDDLWTSSRRRSPAKAEGHNLGGRLRSNRTLGSRSAGACECVKPWDSCINKDR